MKSIIALSVLFVAQAAAKIGFGPCPVINNVMSFANYQSAYPLTTSYNHKLVFGDKAADDLLALAKSFVAQIPNFKCADLFPQALYYADAAIWNPLYNQPADSFVLNLLGFHGASFTEAIYYCIDTARAPGVLRMAVNAGIPIPKEVLDIYSTVNQIQQAFNFLNIQFRFEGMMVTTASYAAFNAAANTWLDGQIAKIPEYTRGDFIDYKTGCP